jgi:uncharacterized membrane protein YeaQ/YmgE (transglycosylase-associated protein family)
VHRQGSDESIEFGLQVFRHAFRFVDVVGQLWVDLLFGFVFGLLAEHVCYKPGGSGNPQREMASSPGAVTRGAEMIGSIVLALIVGAGIGLVARLIMPGKQDITMVPTVIIGALGGLIGSAVASQFGYHNANGGIAWIPLFIGVAAAIALIAIYESVMGRRTGILGRRRDAGMIGRRGRILGRRNRLL